MADINLEVRFMTGEWQARCANCGDGSAVLESRSIHQRKLLDGDGMAAGDGDTILDAQIPGVSFRWRPVRRQLWRYRDVNRERA